MIEFTQTRKPDGFLRFFQTRTRTEPDHLVYFKPGQTQTRKSNPRVPDRWKISIFIANNEYNTAKSTLAKLDL